MALNLATLKTRSLTATAFVVVMLTGLLWNHWSFFILFTIIHFGCWKEYQQLLGKIDPEYTSITPFHKYGVRLAGWCIMLFFLGNNFNIGDFSFHAIGWWLGMICVFVLPIIELLFAGNISLKNIGYSTLGLVYISLSWGLLMDLRCLPEISQATDTGIRVLDAGKFLPIILIVSIWINDTMAYIVGSLIGKTPFSPISPKKTWEGTAGGAILCVLVVALFGWWFGGFRLIDYIVISALAAVMGTLGDLLESKGKRMANVKDSGSIMPGHGGFLDRFDSLLVATPFVWLYVFFFMK
ncbi:MAG: phosphatidate cytidylyltransferase [Candidatus Pseudobacter hemicellulosilyticus]|uniref:Phosphatidate cytidylyltransferase n=1 Tax=Candidatus Pseudobacter hemicellulosilyticus TaxID=3121375 RepID=A0AAJ5WV22_9BACT|nr:MAG: phosphatidate cytidylyltransferase [Pseudobacter sp.]